MAGLLAARVLTDHFERVTIVERDVYPEGSIFRPGVPQMRHLHGLLARGRLILEQYFPGLGQELAEAGAQRFNMPDEVLWLSPTTWGRRDRSATSGIPIVSCSRALLDFHVRRRTLALERVSVVEGHVVEGLLFSADGHAVTGVRLRRRGAAPDRDAANSEAGTPPTSASASELMADLVVDASGRESRLSEWLASAGYPVPPVTRIDPHLGYASRLYAPPEHARPDWKMLLINARSPVTRGGGILVIEQGNWMVLAGGYGGDYPPTDEAEFVAFARGMRTPLFAQAIQAARPLGPIYGYRYTENRWRHYEKLARWPEGLLATGDAVVAFNPIYGQGMSVAAVDATLLAACLGEQRQRKPDGDLGGLGARFQRALAKAAVVPWLMATGEDLRFPTTDGPRPGRVARLAQRYSDRVLAVATEDHAVNVAFWRAAHLVSPLASLFAPAVMFRTLRPRGALGLADPPTTTQFLAPVTARGEGEVLAD